MDQLAALNAFVATVEAGGFSQAARRLGVSKSLLSRQVAHLEAELGVRLLQRTTRRLSPTEAGELYFQRAQRILLDLEEAASEVGQLQTAPRGKLRVSAPMSFGVLHLTPALPSFLAACPELELELSLSDRFVDLIEEGVDVAVRIGRLSDSSLIARHVAPIRRAVCASPAYLARCGTPAVPTDLAAHACLSHIGMGPAEWRFAIGGKLETVRVQSRLSAGNGEALRILALAGLGLVYLPTFFVGDDLRSGALVSVLEDYVPQDSALYGVYPHSRHLSAKVRAFLDFLGASFGPEPPWDG
ncbi:MAG: LysR family transcriptional regulator [Magnetospirillum gryphiswaldense]|nr:LysR family transcriptional regulator [Magnetospirillum gryphiswaldense]